jgi:ATP-dependent Clp protease ATP-binding subunit ClpC
MKILKRLRTDVGRDAAEEIEESLKTLAQKKDDIPAKSRPPMTRRAKNVIEYSLEQAMTLRHARVDTGDLLLAMLLEKEGAAFQILTNRGLTFEVVRDKIQSIPHQ